jgi:ABC-2 type transport system permease protein
VNAFPFLLLPSVWAWRNRTKTSERGDLLRAGFFGCVGLAVYAALILGAMWVTTQIARYEELGDFLLRLGLSWLFLTCLSFLAFSGIVTSLSTFFLSEDLRLLFVAPVARQRLFYARFAKTVGQASWMVIALIVPVLVGVGLARSASLVYYLTAVAVLLPFAVIPVACGSAVTLLLVNVFPARRARDLLMLMGLVFAGAIVLLLRYIQPEQLLRVESMPDVMAFFSTLQSPVTPLLPSFWAGETVFASLQGGWDGLHAAALWTTAMAATVLLRGAAERWHFSGYSKSQEARKARFARHLIVEQLASAMPLSAVRRALLVKDVKVFLRDVTQWSQLLLLLALVLIYLYNFRVLDLDRIPAMGGLLKNAYAFLNLGLAGLVMATVAVRFVFPAVSSEGAAFWIVRTAPVTLSDFLWSKYWAGLVPVACLTTGLTVAANELLGIDPFLKVLTTVAIIVMSVALVGLAVGLGACYPRFDADNANQVAGSFGGVAFMIAAVFFVLVTIALLGWPSSVYLFHQARHRPIPAGQQALMAACFASALAMSMLTWRYAMRAGIAALNRMDRA